MTELYPEYVAFLGTWNEWINIIAQIFVGIAILLFWYFVVKVAAISDPKVKHDFINTWKIRILWYSILSLTIAGGLYLNTIGTEIVKEEPIWFFVRFLITISFTVIIGLIFKSLIKVYYPFLVYKRLSELRHKPRINPINGNELKLMSEEKEDEYLTDEMIQEESRHMVDYDVWLDEETGYTKIERYDGSSLAIECSSCGYRTLRVGHEQVWRSPTSDKKGKMINNFECSFCGFEEVRIIKTKRLPNRPGLAEVYEKN